MRTLLLVLLLAAPDTDTNVPADCKNVVLRGSLENSRLVFQNSGKGHVAFIGGSITEMNGYRPMVAENLQRRFPKTAFTITDAGISSTCSTTGAFRLQDQVLSKGPVDLFFVEFAVNDDQDAQHARRECIRGLEGILLHVRAHNPNADVVVTHFVNEGMLETFRKGEEPLSSRSHNEVIERHQVSGIELNREISGRIQSGALTWKQFGGVHPGPDGNRICANMIERLLDRAWAAPAAAGATPKPHAVLPPLDANSYDRGRFVDPAEAAIAGGWTIETPDWSALAGECRGRFKKEKLLCATKPGASLTLAFKGRAIGITLLAGPDAGMLEVSIDGSAPRRVDLYHRHSGGLHYPRSVVFDADLADGEHRLTMTLTDAKNEKSKGTAARILKFCAN